MSLAEESARAVDEGNAKRMAELRAVIHAAGVYDAFHEYMQIVRNPNAAYSKRVAERQIAAV